MLRIHSLAISRIGGIPKLNLTFGPGVNIICGPNGVGKTTILECLQRSFVSHGVPEVRRNAGATLGSWTLAISTSEVSEADKLQGQSKSHYNCSFTREAFHPSEKAGFDVGLYTSKKRLISFDTKRVFQYLAVEAITADPDQDKPSVFPDLDKSAREIKQWFLNRYVWSAHPKSLTMEQEQNLALAIQCFSLIDEKVAFSRVIPSSHDILVSTPHGEIYFEYLSSGYKSCLFLALGLIKEIEFRFKPNGVFAHDFDGVLLIDEVDLHLHPEWQTKIVWILKQLLPKAQIFVTTHSPHIIQTADPGEVISLGFDENRTVCLREVPNGKYGFQGWTVEEILRDVMGLNDTRSPAYAAALASFEAAMEAEDQESATCAFDVLDEMLHPTSPVRKLLRLQLAAIGGRSV